MKVFYTKKITWIMMFVMISSSIPSEENPDLEQWFEQEINQEPNNTQSSHSNNNNKDFTGKPSQWQFQNENRTWNLDIMGAVDTVGEWDKNQTHNTQNQYYIRTGELGLYSAIDQLAYGTLTWAAHYEGGILTAEIHEANFLFPSTLIPRTNIRLGKMFPDVGRLNGFHQHDWHFTTPPIVHKKLLSQEGILDTGIEFSYLFPWSFWQELSIGIYNGKVFGHGDTQGNDNQTHTEHTHTQGDNKQNPLLTMHLKHFIPISDYWGTEWGFSYLRWHPDSEPNKVNHQYGIDFYLKFKKGKLESFIFQSEIWYRETKEKTKDRWKYFYDDQYNLKTTLADYSYVFDPPKKIEVLKTQIGWYQFIEYQLSEQWFIGYRYDYYRIPTRQKTNVYTYQKEYQRNGLEENSLIITYKPSEFSYFRNQISSTIDFETGLRTWQYYLQAVFIIGKHPAHKY